MTPIAIPATISFNGTPAAIKAKHDEQVEAIELEPFEDKTSDTTLIVYGKSVLLGIIGNIAFSAKAPCPNSLLPGPLDLPTSPTDH
jgi:hypothetical protein